jgi:hypothetical protein
MYLQCCNDRFTVIKPCSPTVNSTPNSSFLLGVVYVDSNNICWTATNSGTETTYNSVNTYTTYNGDVCTDCVKEFIGECSQIPDPTCECIEVTVTESDISDATGNTLYDYTVFVNIWSCDTNETISFPFTS